MSRLTMRNCTTSKAFLIDFDDDDVKDAIQKLADYEDAEEQGLLHKTPCKMGDTIYFIDEESGKVFQSIVARFWIAKLQSFVIDYDGRRFNFKQFEKTWFLDRDKAEAESALAEKGAENE